MASSRDIRRRIKSVKNTQQITKAMQLVAASKMKRAQDTAIAGRDYSAMLNSLIANLRLNVEELNHPFWNTVEGGRELNIVIATDKGLCGGLNSNLFRQVNSLKGADADFITVGKKARSYLAKFNYNLIADYEVRDPVAFADVKKIGKKLVDLFLEGNISRVNVVYTKYVNTLQQDPHIAQLLPLDPENIMGEVFYLRKNSFASEALPGGILLEPDRIRLLKTLLPIVVNYLLFQMVLEARASEHSARMVAMKSASDNAKNIIKDLTLQYNKIRQAAITNELLEITTAMRALE